jgi:regulator of sigma E protease
MLTIITFVLVLSLLVFVHELGHFWVARRFGVKAEEFGFGFPPRIFGFYKSKEGKWKKVSGSKEVVDAQDTIYSINWIPLGGFVKIKGEDGESTKDPDSFASKKIWQRAAILLAGVTMNIVLAGVLIIFGFMLGLPQTLDGVGKNAIVSDQQIQIVNINKDSPAEKAGLEIGDVIVSIDDKGFNDGEGLQKYVSEHSNETLAYAIKRGDEELKLDIETNYAHNDSIKGIGISITDTGIVRYPFFTAIWEGIKATAYLFWAIVSAFYFLLKGLVMGQGMSAEVAGPVGIATLTGQVARLGFVYLLQFTAMLSINLAIINAFPFPALDGGRLLFLLIEKIKGSPVKQEFEAIVHNVGFIILMLFVLVVTYKDIAKYSGWFISVWQKISG